MIETAKRVDNGILGAFEKIKKGFSHNRKTSLKARKEKLRKILKWVLSNEGRIKKAVYEDFKKPGFEADLSEIYPIVSEIRYTLSHLHKWTSKRKVDAPLTFLGTTSYTIHEPKGACLILAPWNYPFELCISPLIPCLAAGNTAIIKPSEITPNTAQLVKEMIDELFDESEVKVITGDADVSEQLIKLPFDHIFFTGSTKIGKLVMKAAAENLTSVTLELGGKSPAVIDKKCNLDDAAEKIAWGKFLNTGQTCVAPDYVLVHNDNITEFNSKLSEHVKRLFQGKDSSFINSDSFGRIVNDQNYNRLNSLLQDSLSNGAEMVLGENPAAEENYIPPVILTGVKLNSKIMQEEIFGPILPVISYSEFDECVEIINSMPKPLAMYYFGKSTKNREQLLGQTSAGTVGINDCVIHYGHHELPFGGVNHSGIGKSHGYYGFKEFSHEKGVLKQRIGMTISKFIYPPYGSSKKAIMSLMKKYF